MTTKKKDELVSVRQAASECGRNTETIRRWIWGGKLPAQKLGNQLFIKKSDLASYCRLPARNLPAKVGETATVEYRAEQKPDFLEQAQAFRSRLKARGYPEVDTSALVRKSREDRVNQIEQSMKDTAEALRRRDALLDFLKKAKAIRNEIHARTGEVFNAEEMIRELRDEREHELE